MLIFFYLCGTLILPSVSPYLSLSASLSGKLFAIFLLIERYCSVARVNNNKAKYANCFTNSLNISKHLCEDFLFVLKYCCMQYILSMVYKIFFLYLLLHTSVILPIITKFRAFLSCSTFIRERPSPFPSAI